MIQGVAVFGEDEQLAATVLQFLELGARSRQSRNARSALESVAVIANAAGLGEQIP